MTKTRWIGVLWASLAVLGHSLTAVGQSAAVPARPVTIGTLDSSGLKASGPRLFLTPAEIEQARRKIAADSRAKDVYDRLIVEADKALETKIEPLDESWWTQARDKPWEQTYPEVYENTSLKPLAIARPAGVLATAWLLTGQDRHADKAIALAMNLSSYSFEAEHYDVGMNYAGWGTEVLRVYDALWPRMSADQRRAMDQFMSRLASAVLKNDIYWIENNIGGGINNHLAWHKMMIGLLGLFYERSDLVDFCLHGPRAMVPLLEVGLLDDGLWCESSLVYQFAAIIPMLVMADCQKRMGHHPELGELVAADGRTVKQSFDAMFNVLAPNGMIPPIGDAYGLRKPLWENHLYEYTWGLWADPRHAWLIAKNPKPSPRYLFVPPIPADIRPPAIRSILLPEHGYAFLRSHADEQYWSDEAVCAFLTYDRSNVHANADKLSLMLFGQGKMLLTDAEGRATVPHAFSSRIQRELNRGGLSQNTVMIDGKDQICHPRMLRLIEYRDLPDEKRVTAADEEGLLYPGVRQMRTVALTSDYVLDVFQVRGDADRQIDWIAHMLSEKATMPAGSNPALKRCEPFALPKDGAWQWLRDGRSFTPDDDVRLEWREDTARLRLVMMPQRIERVILCGYPATDEPASGDVPMLIVRQRGTEAIFAAVWLIGDKPNTAELHRLPNREGRLVFEVKADGRRRAHLLPALQ